MQNKQRGMTFIGLVILITFLGLFVYAGIRLVPVYLEYMNVAKALDSLKTEGGTASQTMLRATLSKRFDVNDISSINIKDVEITREGGDWTINATYDAQTPFIANISFSVHFDKTVTIPAAGGL